MINVFYLKKNTVENILHNLNFQNASIKGKDTVGSFYVFILDPLLALLSDPQINISYMILYLNEICKTIINQLNINFKIFYYVSNIKNYFVNILLKKTNLSMNIFVRLTKRKDILLVQRRMGRKQEKQMNQNIGDEFW